MSRSPSLPVPRTRKRPRVGWTGTPVSPLSGATRATVSTTSCASEPCAGWCSLPGGRSSRGSNRRYSRLRPSPTSTGPEEGGVTSRTGVSRWRIEVRCEQETILNPLSYFGSLQEFGTVSTGDKETPVLSHTKCRLRSPRARGGLGP